MTQQEQQERIERLQMLVDTMQEFITQNGLKGKKKFELMKHMTVGYATAQKTIDTVIYIALLRGGDIMSEIESGIALIKESMEEKVN